MLGDAGHFPMPLVVIAGPPGAGKTTLLLELARRGHATVSDSAREIITERKTKGIPPRPDPVEFAREIYRRDLAKYRRVAATKGPVFFERSAIESREMLLGALRQAGQPAQFEADELEFVNPVFMLPPWQEIYRTDAERDHTFEHALWVYEQTVRCYRAHGYRIDPVPRCGPSQRAEHVLAILACAGSRD